MKKFHMITLLFMLILLLPIQILAEDESIKITEQMQVCNSMEYIRSDGQTDYIYAYYRPQPWQDDESNPTYSSSAFITRFYSTVFGKKVNCQINMQGLPEVSAADGIMNQVTVPQQNDIVYCPINGNPHWAIVKSVNNNSVTLIEQNYRRQALGDVNGDYMIDQVDAILIAQYCVGITLKNFNVSKADVNSDGKVDIKDALLVSQYFMGIINEFPGIEWNTTKDRVLSIEKDKPVFFREADVGGKLSGRVLTNDESAGIAGVTISFSNGSSVITDNNGNWSVDDITGTVTATPSKVGYTFNQHSQTVTGPNNNINFIMTGFSDDFQNQETGWRVLDDMKYSCSYQNGIYMINNSNCGKREISLLPFPVPTDYTIEVDCIDSNSSPQKHNTYGIVFGYVTTNNYYYFNIDPVSRQFSLDYYHPLNSQFDIPTKSNFINITGNKLKLVKFGNQAELWINGNKVKTVTLSQPPGNRIGIMNFNDSLTSSMISSFDNFKFTANSN